MTSRNKSPAPLFVAIEPGGGDANQPIARISWAGETSDGAAVAGVAEHGDVNAVAIDDAVRDVVAMVPGGVIFVGDALFDAPRLADRAGAETPIWRDWLLALAPFGQARNLAAILEVAEARADPMNPASRLCEAWREARRRAQVTRRS